MFFCEFCKICKNTFFHRTPPVADSEKLKAEAVVRRCSVKKVFLEFSLNSQENTCASISFLQPLASNFIKIKSLRQVFSCEFCEHLSKNTFFYRNTPVAAYVKAWNFTKIRFRQGCFFVNFLKIFGTYFDTLQEFSQNFSKSSQKVHKNTGEKMFAKYLSADGCFVKATILLKQQYILDFLTYANFNNMSGPLHVRINGCILY